MLTLGQIDVVSQRSASKVDGLRKTLESYQSALVAFSGGVDSTFVLKVAKDVLGDQVVALTTMSASVPAQEQVAAKNLAQCIGARHIAVHSQELSIPDYVRNPSNRCYFCKTELYELCEQKRTELGLRFVIDGLNADDLKDHRPGRAAAQEHRVQSPLALAGLTKEEIRAWSYRLGLPTWAKPQMPCLASRIPYGTEVTERRLAQIEGAESELRQLGLRIFRVRYHGDVARLEIGAEEFERFSSPRFREVVNEALKKHGFSFIALDLEPFRSGRLNDALSSENPDDFSGPTAGHR